MRPLPALWEDYGNECRRISLLLIVFVVEFVIMSASILYYFVRSIHFYYFFAELVFFIDLLSPGCSYFCIGCKFVSLRKDFEFVFICSLYFVWSLEILLSSCSVCLYSASPSRYGIVFVLALSLWVE